MSEENVDAVKRGHRAFNAGDLDAWLAEADPEVEWHTTFEARFEGRQRIYRGHDGLREAWEEYRGGPSGDFFASQIGEFRDLGESVLLLGHLDLTGRSGGVELGQEFAQLVTFRGGKCLHVQDFLSHAEGLEAAGLSE